MLFLREKNPRFMRPCAQTSRLSSSRRAVSINSFDAPSSGDHKASPCSHKVSPRSVDNSSFTKPSKASPEIAHKPSLSDHKGSPSDHPTSLCAHKPSLCSDHKTSLLDHKPSLCAHKPSLWLIFPFCLQGFACS